MKQLLETARCVQVATLLMHFINVLYAQLVIARMDNTMIKVKISASVVTLNANNVLED